MNWRNYTWLLGVLGMGLLVAACSVWLVAGSLTNWAMGLGIASAVLLAGYGLLDRERLQEGASSRAFSYSAGAVMVTVLGAVLGGMLLTLAKEYEQTADITSSGQHTLSEQTRSVLDGLQSPVEVYALFRKDSPRHQSFERLALRVTQYSDNIVYKHIDPLMEPHRVQELVQKTGRDDLDRIADSGIVVMRQGKRRRRIESAFDEQAVTNNLIRLQSGSDHLVCWSDGHLERDPDKDDTADGYGIVNLRLEDRNFVISKTRIHTQGIRSACEVFVIAGPKVDFAPVELEALAAYVASGGQVLMLLDSPVEGVNVPGLATELARYGVNAGEDVVLENSPEHVTVSSNKERLQIYSQANFSQHPVMDGLPQGVVVAWPRSVGGVQPDVPGIQAADLMVSSQMSWADLNFSFSSEEPPIPEPALGEVLSNVPMATFVQIDDPSVLNVQIDPNRPVEQDGPTPYDGPQVLKPRADLIPKDYAPKPGGRLLVIGDADLASNMLSGQYNNGDLYLNAVAMLAGEEDQLGEGSANTGDFLTLSVMQLAIVLLIGVLLVPGLAALLGVILLVRRRFL